MFIERLNSLMEEHGVTRTKLLSDLKMGKNQFRVWETGGKPNPSTISAIATYFDVSPDYLTDERTKSFRIKVEERSDLRSQLPPLEYNPNHLFFHGIVFGHTTKHRVE